MRATRTTHCVETIKMIVTPTAEPLLRVEGNRPELYKNAGNMGIRLSQALCT